MKCQYVGDGGKQCESEANRDIRVVTARIGWRLFLREDHVGAVMQQLKLIIDQMEITQVEQPERIER